MKTMYLVSEIVDEDGGFGDAIETTVPLPIFSTYAKAKNYVKKYSKAIEYEDPYMPLHYGELKIDSVVSEPKLSMSAENLPNYDKRINWDDEDDDNE